MQNALLQTHLYSFFSFIVICFVYTFGIVWYYDILISESKFELNSKCPANSPLLFSIAVGVLSFWLTFHRQFVLLHRFSNRPKRALTSRFLISLLNYCRVPIEYFVELQRKAQEDVNKARHKPRDSLEVMSWVQLQIVGWHIWIGSWQAAFLRASGKK